MCVWERTRSSWSGFSVQAAASRAKCEINNRRLSYLPYPSKSLELQAGPIEVASISGPHCTHVVGQSNWVVATLRLEMPPPPSPSIRRSALSSGSPIGIKDSPAWSCLFCSRLPLQMQITGLFEKKIAARARHTNRISEQKNGGVQPCVKHSAVTTCALPPTSQPSMTQTNAICSTTSPLACCESS